MVKKHRKFLSLLLCILMVITMMPVRAYGADTPQPLTSGISQTEVQSESQSNNQDANQTENQSANRSAGHQTENQSANRSAGHQTENQSANRSAGHQTENQGAYRSTGQSENQGVNQNAGHNELQSKGLSKMQSLNQSAGGSGANETFTVEFRVNGILFPGETQQIKAGNLVSKPNINTGYYLLGWYRDEKCEYKWDFAEDKVYSDITLYARSMSIIDVNDEEDLRNKLIGYSESFIIRLVKDITIQDKDKKIQDSSLIIDRNVVLDLNGHNLSITQKANGIKIINNSTLRIIDSGSNVNNTLTVMVNSESDNYAYYAGINTSQGKLIIDSGRVTVNGGPYSAAIGCELSVVYFGEIIINGGVVNAEGGKWAAAIGSGYDSGGGNVIIN